ncbi:MAG: hypothetical protein HPY70_10615 [Firmicutes bacterium]|nr:hypothetical protein [Bacillota bacterium]
MKVLFYGDKERKLLLEKELKRITEIIKGLDILVYTPNEIEELLKVNSFVRKILREGRVIHES